MEIKKFIHKGSSVVLDGFCIAIDRYCEKEILNAVEKQKEQDIHCAIAAFLELKVPETDIMHLLSKFYNVDSITDATELITTVKVKNQLNALRDYLEELGMNRIEVVEYFKNHHVKTELGKDSKLQNMPVNKLKAYFDKH